MALRNATLASIPDVAKAGYRRWDGHTDGLNGSQHVGDEQKQKQRKCSYLFVFFGGPLFLEV